MPDFIDAAKTNIGNSMGAGKSAIGSFDPNAWQQSTNAGFNALWGQQQGQQDDYIKRYKDTIMGMPGATDWYQKGNDMYGVAPLKQNATVLQNAVLTTPQNNINAAKGFNYDANQIANKTGQDLARLSPAATAATNTAQNAEQLAAGYAGAGMAQNQVELQPVQEEGQMLADIWSRQASGFTTTAQQQLEGLIAKMNAGVQLSQTEMAAYSQLASAEASYQGSMASANATVNAAKIGNTYKALGPSDTLLNTASGKAFRAY